MTINSVVLYDLMYTLIAPKCHAELYRLLRLDEKNTGPRFRHGRCGKAYWPRHEAWLENALYDVPKPERDAWCAPAQQAFPDPVHPNLTLASYIYTLLQDALRSWPGGCESVYDAVLKVCAARDVGRRHMEDIARLGPQRMDEVLAYIIRCAKNACGDLCAQEAPAIARIALDAPQPAQAAAPLSPVSPQTDVLGEIARIEDALRCPPTAQDYAQKQRRALHSVNAVLRYAQHANSVLLGRMMQEG